MVVGGFGVLGSAESHGWMMISEIICIVITIDSGKGILNMWYRDFDTMVDA